MHSCDNPACVNVDHLSLGTQKANMADCAAKGRTRRSRLLPMVGSIKTLKEGGVPQRQIARIMGVSPQLITLLLQGKLLHTGAANHG